jgi:peroxiredoxin Q/BCP
MNMTLKENMIAPDFALPDQDGNIRKLSDFRGKPVILYFYPKDFTSGCTTEACNFRDDYSQYEDAGVVIIGVSPDPQSSHQKFTEKHNLPFILLSDVDHEVLLLYGAWGMKKSYGKEKEGVLRTTFVIDEIGFIKKVFKRVKPAQHSSEVLAELNLEK